MAAPGLPNWKQALAQQLGIRLTPAVDHYFDLWARAEGGDASNNPFNTTQPGYGAVGNYNGVGVKNYADPMGGIKATAATLTNGKYDNILQALRQGTDVHAMAQALYNSPWGTGGLVLKMLGVDPGPQQDSSGSTPPSAGGGQPGATSPQLMPSKLDTLVQNAAPSAFGVSLLQRLGGRAGRAAQAAQAPIPFKLTAPSGAAISPSGGDGMPPLTGEAPVAQDVSKWVKVSSNANRAGVGIQPDVVNFVDQVAQVYGKPLTIGTGTNHNQFVVGTHRESDHWTGYAADIPATGKTLTRLGQDALIAAGADPNWARKQTGGVFNIGGKQILFNTNVGGNHFNHLHVGVRTR